MSRFVDINEDDVVDVESMNNEEGASQPQDPTQDTQSKSNKQSKMKKLSDSQTHLTFQDEQIVQWKFDQNTNRKALVEMIVQDELPFSFVEGKGFRKFLSICQPLFKVPCRTTVTHDALQMFQDHKKKIYDLIKENKSRICLTTDSWTSIQKVNYMTITAHFIDNDWRLVKKVLNFCLLESYREVEIGKAIEMCLLGWDIDNLLTISVDNTSSNDVAIDYLKRKFASWPKCVLGGKWIHIRCVSHILNLVVQDGISHADASINNIRGAVKWVSYSPSRITRFKKYAEMEKCESSKNLILDVPTRWNSTYLLLETAQLYEKAFNRYYCEDRHFAEELEKSNLSMPSLLDWKNARKLTRFLKHFYDVTLKVSCTSHVTSHTFVDDISSIVVLMSDDSEVMNELGLVDMVTRMKLKFDKYFGEIEKLNMLLYISMILDPRNKLCYLELLLVEVYGNERGKHMKEMIEDALKELYNEYMRIHAQSSTDSSSSLVLGKRVAMDETTPNPTIRSKIMEKLKMQMSECVSMYSTKSDLDKFLNEAIEDDSENFDILLWWKVNRMRFPILSLMARDVLAIPISTVASESVFSTSGRVLDPFRSSLTPTIVEALICLQDWIRPGPKPSVEEDLDKLHQIEEGLQSGCASNKI